VTNARRIRALVVDDEPLAREMIREMLEDDSEVEIVAECANGREAVEAIKSLQSSGHLVAMVPAELAGTEAECSAIESGLERCRVFAGHGVSLVMPEAGCGAHGRCR